MPKSINKQNASSSNWKGFLLFNKKIFFFYIIIELIKYNNVILIQRVLMWEKVEQNRVGGSNRVPLLFDDRYFQLC